uniref:PH domain-containing protein n=1 Tax=Denticeps clupeoides TaxID=299321 RepID=A0AAY4DYL8_9TELE
MKSRCWRVDVSGVGMGSHSSVVSLCRCSRRSSDLDMNGKAGGRAPVNSTNGGNTNGNNVAMVSEPPTESQPNVRGVRTPKRAATFGKRSNSMRRNPKAEVTRQGWLHKQASSGVKQWNKRWFVLTDHCLFYYKDDKEEGVLGSLPLLSFRIGLVQPPDNITRKHAFKVWYEEEEEEEETGDGSVGKGGVAFCLQVEHAGTRTYYFSAESQEEQEAWVQAMSEAARVQIAPASNSEQGPSEEQYHIIVSKTADPHPYAEGEGGPGPTEIKDNGQHQVNGVMEDRETARTTPHLPPETNGRVGGDKGHRPNGWGSYTPSSTPAYPSHPDTPREVREVREVPPEPQENVVLRRGFVPRTAPERMAQRKSSMSQLQQWVNQRRGVAAQEDMHSPSRYYTVNRGVSTYYDGVYGGPQFVEEYPLYPPGVRPDSICSVSAAFDHPSHRWTAEEKRRSLRDGHVYSAPQWAPQPHALFYNQLDSAQNSMRRLSVQPRSRSVPRSPSSSSGGPYSPSPRSYASPLRSPSGHFDRAPSRMRDDAVYAEPSVYGLRRSLSSPKYDYPGDRRSLSQGIYQYNYPPSPSLHNKMEDILDVQLQRNLEFLDQQVPPFHDYRDLYPTLKLNEIETTKLLDRLCEQNRILREQEAVVHRLRMEKDSLEAGLVAVHQELEMYRGQPLGMEKLQLKKESLQNQLINIRGELSQASSALTNTRMEVEALEDEANAIHGDLWEQLNAGGKGELVHRHLQKEFWRVQDVLEGLHKNNLSRGTDTAKHRASGASGSFSTNSPASPLSSISLTSPLSPFSPVSGSQVSPTKQLGSEVKTFSLPETRGLFKPRSQPEWNELDERSFNGRRPFRFEVHVYLSSHPGLRIKCDVFFFNKVGVVPPRTKSPADDQGNSYDPVHRRNGKVSNGHISRERPKSAVFPAEVKSKMSVQEQNERIRRNQSSSVRDKRRSLNLSSSQQIDGFRPSYRVVRRRLTAHEVDIKDLEAAVRGEGVESPREEIARLRRQMEPQHYDLDIGKELSAPEKVLIPERYLDMDSGDPLSPEEMHEKQKRVERIKTLIAKSSMQNVVPVLDGPTESQSNPEQQLQEQEKRIEISCALAAEASRRSRLLSVQCVPSPPASPTSVAPPPSTEFSDSSHIMKV